MTVAEELREISLQSGRIAPDRLAQRLRALEHAFPDLYYREKVGSAAYYMEILADPQQLQQYKDPSQIKVLAALASDDGDRGRGEARWHQDGNQ